MNNKYLKMLSVLLLGLMLFIGVPSLVSAETINLTSNSVGSIPLNATNRVYVLEKTVDLTDDAITENDIYQVFTIKANTLCRAAVLRIDTAAVGTTLTIDVGVTGDASLVSDANGKTAQTNAPALIGLAEASVQSVWYSAADTIDVTMDVATAITAGPKFTLMVECVDFN